MNVQPDPTMVSTIQALDVALMLFMMVTAVMVVRLRNLFAAVMVMGAFSLLSAGLFTVLDAVDVAFTEAAVGAGISTVLMLGTLALTPTVERNKPKNDLLALCVVIGTGVMLIYSTQDMPAVGSPDAPIHQHVANVYVNESEAKTGVPNIVTAVLASYRGYDTMGETSVIFTAGIGVMLILGGRRRRYPLRAEDGTARAAIETSDDPRAASGETA